jgi:hypothetical protein
MWVIWRLSYPSYFNNIYLLPHVMTILYGESKHFRQAVEHIKDYNRPQLVSLFAYHNRMESECSKLQNSNSINNWTIKRSLYYITRLLDFTDVSVYGCAVEYPCTASLSVTSTLLITSWVETQTTPLRYVFKFAQFQIQPPLKHSHCSRLANLQSVCVCGCWYNHICWSYYCAVFPTASIWGTCVT